MDGDAEGNDEGEGWTIGRLVRCAAGRLSQCMAGSGSRDVVIWMLRSLIVLHQLRFTFPRTAHASVRPAAVWPAAVRPAPVRPAAVRPAAARPAAVRPAVAPPVAWSVVVWMARSVALGQRAG